jgi:nucleotide-binding universal stress UspA family protein
MLKTILLALDGSTYSEAAVELGIRFAKRCDAMLVGLGVLDEPTIRKPEPVPLGGFYYKRHRDDTLIQEAHERIQQFLDRFASRCAEAGVSCKVHEGDRRALGADPPGSSALRPDHPGPADLLPL